MKPTILLVEDEIKIADSIKRGLEEQNYWVEKYGDGESALTFYRENHKVDLAILDINLPNINGVQVLQQIRSINQSLPVIMLTARNDIADKTDSFETGADDYITKPFEFQELLLRIKALLKRSTIVDPIVENKLSIRDLEIDLNTKQVVRSGAVIPLTSKEYSLLLYFVHNKNTVLSRRDIAKQVWGIDFDRETNVIDVYVNFLRNKIDKGFESKIIHTQVGMGYIAKDRDE
ncbi:MAG: response regulator transcription factor [Chitinophagaceae bacterium]|uniref:response regulator transcription factor n=1 Tax=unclassified Paraflavitalea TaxID=2798305 RepID=UPI003D34144E|nr:response regulator transcription factor [Chitinophagaceae bacterium]